MSARGFPIRIITDVLFVSNGDYKHSDMHHASPRTRTKSSFIEQETSFLMFLDSSPEPVGLTKKKKKTIYMK